MIEGVQIDAVLTDDESELVTIINGLEEQADLQEDRIEKTKQAAHLMIFGSVTFLGISFLEKGAYDKSEYLAVSAGLIVGGLERVLRERNLIKSVRSKNLLAAQLKQELEPADLDRYEERDELDFEDDEEDDEDQDDDLYLV